MCDTVKFVLPAYSHSRQTLVTRRNTSGATRSDIRGHRHQSFPIVHWQQRQELTLCGHKQIISLLCLSIEQPDTHTVQWAWQHVCWRLPLHSHFVSKCAFVIIQRLCLQSQGFQQHFIYYSKLLKVAPWAKQMKYEKLEVLSCACFSDLF